MKPMLIWFFSCCVILPASAIQTELVAIGNAAFPDIQITARIWDEEGQISADELPSVSLREDDQVIPISEMRTMPTVISTAILILIDTSGSMAGEPLREAVTLCKQLLALRSSNAQFGLARFDDEYTEVVPLPAEKAALAEALDSLQTRGQHTILRDAIYAALRQLRRTEVQSRRILLLSDGKDEQSALQLGDAIRAAEEQRVTIHTIQVGAAQGGDLERLADLTGGLYRHVSGITPAWLERLVAPTAAQLLSIRYRSRAEGVGSRTVLLTFNDRGVSSTAAGSYESPPVPRRSLGWMFWLASLLAAGCLTFGAMLWHRRGRHRAETVGVATSPGKTGERPAVAQFEMRRQDGQEQIIPIGPRALVGRAPTNDVVLANESVSKQHMRIAFQDGIFRVYDLGSTNGVLVNGERVNQCPLYDGDRIQLGHVELIFRRLDVRSRQ